MQCVPGLSFDGGSKDESLAITNVNNYCSIWLPASGKKKKFLHRDADCLDPPLHCTGSSNDPHYKETETCSKYS